MVTDVGANAKMNEFCAIMGLCNLKHIDEVIEERKKRYLYYMEQLKKVTGICFFEKNSNASLNYSYFPIMIDSHYKMNRDELYDLLRENDIYARKYFYPITADQACFRNKYRDDRLEVARKLSKNILIIPLFDTLELESIEKIVKIFVDTDGI